jgi:HK97 family phage major capsid protein
VSGNGANRPTGFLTADKVLTADGTRGFGDIQYFQTGNATGFAATNPGDVLFDAVYGLKPAHRAQAQWAMSRNTLSQLRKFKADTDEQYLWQPGLQLGQPGTLLGYPVLEAEAMPDVGGDEFPIAFADWRRAYMLVDLVGMRMTVDDNITTPGAVKWYIRRRLGGKLYNDDAIKLIKVEAPTT